MFRSSLVSYAVGVHSANVYVSVEGPKTTKKALSVAHEAARYYKMRKPYTIEIWLVVDGKIQWSVYKEVVEANA